MFLEAAITNATSVPVLAFVLGLLDVAIKSDLLLPESVYQGPSMYLLLGIIIKAGVARQSMLIRFFQVTVGTIHLSRTAGGGNL